MNAVLDGLNAVLVGDSTLTTMLSSLGGQPAIFTIAPVPGIGKLRYVVIREALADVDAGSKNHDGREVTHDIGIYDTESGSRDFVEAAGERVRQLFNRKVVPVTGYVNIISSARGPFAAPVGDQTYGRIVTVTLTVMEAL